MLNFICVLCLIITGAIANVIDLGNSTHPGHAIAILNDTVAVSRALSSTCSISSTQTSLQATIITNQLSTEAFTCGLLNFQISQSGNPAQLSLSITSQRGSTGEKKFYIHTLTKLNWYRANHYCEAEGYRLASFNSQAETNQALALITQAGFLLPDQRFWTAGTRLGFDSTYYWMGDDRPWSYTNWGAGEPNNNGGLEACTEFSSINNRGWAWNDENCDTKLFFLCEEDQLTEQLKKDA